MRRNGDHPLPPELGGHVLGEEIASGSRGRLFRALRGERRFALKVLEPHARADRTVLERFLRDAPDRIRHPNLLPVETVGEDGDRLFFATRLLRGDSLRHILDDLLAGAARRPSLCPIAVGPDGTPRPDYLHHALRLLAEAAEGLGRAHAQGLCHLRLEPRRLVFSPGGRLVVTGFEGGEDIPRAASPGSGESDRLESLAYRAPEQLEDGPRSPATDVWALGCILYELATLRPAFRAGDETELRRAIAAADPVPPRRERPDLPPAVEHCIRRALSRTPEERYPHAQAFAEDLRRAAQGALPEGLELVPAATEGDAATDGGNDKALRDELEELRRENAKLRDDEPRLRARERRLADGEQRNAQEERRLAAEGERLQEEEQRLEDERGRLTQEADRLIAEERRLQEREEELELARDRLEASEARHAEMQARARSRESESTAELARLREELETAEGERERAAAEAGSARAELAAVRRRARWRVPIAAAGLLVVLVLVALALRLGRELGHREREVEAMRQSLAAAAAGDPDAAREAGESLRALPDAGSSAAVVDRARRGLAGARRRETALRRALRALHDGRPAAAAAAVSVALGPGGDPVAGAGPDREELETLRGALRERAQRDPIIAGLEDRRASVRAASLRALLDARRSGERDGPLPGAVARALRDPDSRVRDAAFALYVAAGKGTTLRTALGLGADRPVEPLEARVFLRAVEAFAAIGDDASRETLDGFGLEAARRLDRAGTPIALPPNLEVDPGGADPDAFVTAWIAQRAKLAPGDLLARVPSLRERRSLLTALARALPVAARAAAGDKTHGRATRATAVKALAGIARGGHPRAAGEALDGLVELGAAPPLAEIVHRPLPFGLRQAALERLTALACQEEEEEETARAERDGHAGSPGSGEARAGIPPRAREAAMHLASAALRCPEPRIRREARDRVAALPPGTLPVAESVRLVVSDLHDRRRRARGLERLAGLPGPARRALALDLLAHPDADVRDGAVELLGRDGDSGLRVPLLLRLGRPERRVRRAALEALRQREDFHAIADAVRATGARASSALAAPARHALDGARSLVARVRTGALDAARDVPVLAKDLREALRAPMRALPRRAWEALSRLVEPIVPGSQREAREETAPAPSAGGPDFSADTGGSENAPLR